MSTYNQLQKSLNKLNLQSSTIENGLYKIIDSYTGYHLVKVLKNCTSYIVIDESLTMIEFAIKVLQNELRYKKK